MGKKDTSLFLSMKEIFIYRVYFQTLLNTVAQVTLLQETARKKFELTHMDKNVEKNFVGLSSATTNTIGSYTAYFKVHKTCVIVAIMIVPVRAKTFKVIIRTAKISKA